MSDVIATFLIRNATAGQAIGIKEAIAMDVEKYGDVRVVSVEVREPEQMRISGAAPHERAEQVKTATPNHSGVPVDKPSTTGRSAGSVSTAYPCHLNCAHYRQEPGQDEGGKMFYGLCRVNGKPVYDLRKRCAAWKERRSTVKS